MTRSGRALITLAILLVACQGRSEEDSFVISHTETAPLPDGVSAVVVDVAGNVQAELYAGATIEQHAVRVDDQVFVTTQAMTVADDTMRSDTRQLAGEAHLRIEQVEDDLVVDPARDQGLILQWGADGDWHTFEPPEGYRWRSVTGLRIDGSGPFLVLVGQACRYELRDAGGANDGAVARHCEFIRRWARTRAAHFRLVPYPVWPETLNRGTLQRRYSLELVDALHSGSI